jgi:phage shock protein A
MEPTPRQRRIVADLRRQSLAQVRPFLVERIAAYEGEIEVLQARLASLRRTRDQLSMQVAGLDVEIAMMSVDSVEAE